MNSEWSERKIARIFDDMAEEYDELLDLWYSWLFSRLHVLILDFLSRTASEHHRTCLDIGCGTGFQSSLLGLCGYQVEGVDLSYDLIRKASAKNVSSYQSVDLFRSPYSFARKYSERARALASGLRGGRPVGLTSFKVASAVALPYPAESFDIINCCGSTLSLVEDYKQAVDEFSRVLRPNGILLLEVENKYNLDLLWPILDGVLLGRLGYDQGLGRSLRNLVSRRKAHLRALFPFSSHGSEVLMPIWLFHSPTLQAELGQRDMVIREVHSIHSLTNLLPSVALDSANPPRALVQAFNLLASIESRVSSLCPFSRTGCSSVFLGVKRS